MLRTFFQLTSCCLVCFSAVVVIRAERLPLKAYTIAEGLPHNTINKIVRDSRGFLWFCTEDGLSRFDGYTFTNFGTIDGLPHRSVNDFLETRQGEIWIATNGGLVRFNPNGVPSSRIAYANETSSAPPAMFTVVVPTDEDRKARVVTVMLETREGTLWCGTLKHLYRLHREANRFEMRSVEVGIGESQKRVSVLDLLEDRHHSLWIGSFSGLFRQSRDGLVTQYTTRDGLPDNNIHDLLEDQDGQLWAATRLGGFFHFTDTPKGSISIAESYKRRDGLPTDWVFQLFETADKKFWLATNAGLVEFIRDLAGKGQFKTYTTRNGLIFPEVNWLAEDGGGNLWLSTFAGAMKLAHGGFSSYDEDDGIAAVNAIFEDQGSTCFRGKVLGDGTRSVFEGARLDLLRAAADFYYVRFGCFDGLRFSWFKPAGTFDFGWVLEQSAVQTPNGEWWTGSNLALYRFPASTSFSQIANARPLSVYTAKEGLIGGVWRVFADSQGNVWTSTIAEATNGLFRWDSSSGVLVNLANTPGLPSLKVELPRSFGEDAAGNVWVGLNSGIARFSHGRSRFFSQAEGVPAGAIMSIYTDAVGRLWLASSRSGLIQVDGPTTEQPKFTTYSITNGLSGNSTEAVTGDTQGRIYVSTGRGVDQLHPESGSIKLFTTADGLAPGKIVAAFRDRSGALWFGTQSGLSRLVPLPAKPATNPPILITGLVVGGERQPISALGANEITLHDLAPGRSQLQIDFVALSFAPGETLRYQYQLEGANTDWIPISEQRSVNFANLSAGRYRFLVRAVNSDGVASSHPATVSFTVLRPFWQRWWFVSLIGIVVALVAYSLYRYRVARLVELERVRTRIASDLHDDIGAGLSRIAVLSEVARHEAQSSPVGERLSVIAGASRELVDSMSDIVWVINPERDQLHDLIQRMRRFASDVFTSSDIEFTFRAPSDEQQLKVSADVRRQLFLIYKECINNIVRHSGCSKAQIVLSVSSGVLELAVKDNGHGFDSARTVEGNGLVNMRQRARMISGDFQVYSNNTGTTVRLKVPLRATVKEHNNRLHRTGPI
jgi:ligand-binding sensor domain-containing protein/signal transduction histidine kinase